ncbi:hypothetical protein ACEOWJ_002018 [Bacillus cereus]|uniref:hypothetical protein n=1 Tax=Bacillus sp. UNC322MFChir4.1 TaxID=1449045 RepID=UPI00068AA092|nr:hypothetical protein [Bacillus sp. UNC322MFChir4.1]
MQTTGLTRGEILVGMQKGDFKPGQRFKEVSSKGIGAIACIVDDEKNETALIWEETKQFLQLRNCLTEEWDLLEESLELEEGEMFVVIDNGVKWYGVLEKETKNVYKTSIALVVHGYKVYKGGTFWKSFKERKFRKATDEELQDFERFMMFHKKGRKMNEFQLGDIGEREDTLYKVVIQSEDNKFEGVIGCVAINETDAPVKYFSANSVELQFCVEDMVG